MEVGGQRYAPALFTPGKDPVPIVHEAGWAPGPVWKGAESFAHTEIRPRTVQPVASRYTDCVIPTHSTAAAAAAVAVAAAAAAAATATATTTTTNNI
jgi:hypothetical protein